MDEGRKRRTNRILLGKKYEEKTSKAMIRNRPDINSVFHPIAYSKQSGLLLIKATPESSRIHGMTSSGVPWFFDRDHSARTLIPHPERKRNLI